MFLIREAYTLLGRVRRGTLVLTLPMCHMLLEVKEPPTPPTGITLKAFSKLSGLFSDILKKKGTDTMPNKYLSLFSTGRSVDLFFETEEECFSWFALLEWLVKKEKERIYALIDVEDPLAPESTTEFDVLLYNSLVGRR